VESPITLRVLKIVLFDHGGPCKVPLVSRGRLAQSEDTSSKNFTDYIFVNSGRFSLCLDLGVQSISHVMDRVRLTCVTLNYSTFALWVLLKEGSNFPR
jgi:hypothetical protein